MSTHQRTIVIGASRGLGRGVAEHLARIGHAVTAVARSGDDLDDLIHGVDGITPIVGDATDAALSRRLLVDIDPTAVILVAGATPMMKPLSEYDWPAFLAPVQVDAKAAFVWAQACLAMPLRPGARFVVFSSGAALHGSPLSGGYAPAKQAQRYIADYTRKEATERGLGFSVQCVLPQLTPNTALGRAGIAGYAAKAGVSPEVFIQRRFGDRPLSPAMAGEQIARLLAERVDGHEFTLGGDGLSVLT